MFLCHFDIVSLCLLRAATQQDDDLASYSPEIHSVSRPNIDPQLEDAMSDRPAVTKIPCCNAVDSVHDDAINGLPFEVVHPIAKRTIPILGFIHPNFLLSGFHRCPRIDLM